MKKYNLLKVLLIVIGFALFLSWVIPYGDGTKSLLGIWDLFNYPYYIMYSFGVYLVFFLAVGVFYGILNKTGVYANILKKVTDKLKGKEFKTLIFLIAGTSLFVSITGLYLEMFFVVPFIISVLLKLGHDKLTALSVTIGSILVGVAGATYGYAIQGYSNQVLGLEVSNSLLVKFVILLAGVMLLIWEVMKHIKKVGMSHNKDDLLYYEKKVTKKRSGAVVIVSLITFALIILGIVNWSYLNGNWTFFTEMHTKISNLTFLNVIFNGSAAFGQWDIMNVSAIILIAALIISFIYSYSFKDTIDSMVTGINKVLPTLAYVFLGLVILYLALTNPFADVVVEWLVNITSKFNVIFAVIATAFESLFVTDIRFLAQSIIPIYTEVCENSSLISLLVQTVYASVMIIAPTGLLLIAGLSYTKVSYFEWVKHIWKFLWKFLIVILITLTIIGLV